MATQRHKDNAKHQFTRSAGRGRETESARRTDTGKGEKRNSSRPRSIFSRNAILHP